jgi:hypothetical protein
MNAPDFKRLAELMSDEAHLQTGSEWEKLPAMKRHVYFYSILVLVIVTMHTYLNF